LQFNAIVSSLLFGNLPKQKLSSGNSHLVGSHEPFCAYEIRLFKRQMRRILFLHRALLVACVSKSVPLRDSIRYKRLL
jgi:hypothetical protein